MRTLLTTTALVALFSAGAIAQDAAAPNAGPSEMMTQGYDLVDTDGLASKLLGFPVYSAASEDAEQLGEINDIVIGQDGQVAAVIVGVGGFLGIGEKNVAVDYSELEWTVAEDDTERLVLNTTREALEAAASVELIEDEPMDTADAPATDEALEDDAAMDTAEAPAADQPVEDDAAMDTAEAPAADKPVDDDAAMDTAEAPADPEAADQNLETGAIAQPETTSDQNAMSEPMAPFDPSIATEFDESALTAEELIGTNVYGPENEHIGVIGDLVLGEEGKIDAIIIDFGGFLGIGVKEVAVGYDDLDFYSDPENRRSLVLNVTREQMEQATAFNRDTYDAERDTQRLQVSQL